MSTLPDEREMLCFVRQRLNDTLSRDPGSVGAFYFRDRFTHTLRVVGWVKRLCRTEACDERITSMAAIFHDVGYDCHFKEEHAILSERICRAYMTEHGFPAGDIEQVCALVAQHSLKKRPAEELSPELRVLMDADLLDELGITIIVWDSMAEGSRHQGDYYTVLERVRRAYSKLVPLLPVLKTKTGYDEYSKGLDVLSAAIKRLEFELDTDYAAAFFADDVSSSNGD